MSARIGLRFYNVLYNILYNISNQTPDLEGIIILPVPAGCGSSVASRDFSSGSTRKRGHAWARRVRAGSATHTGAPRCDLRCPRSGIPAYEQPTHKEPCKVCWLLKNRAHEKHESVWTSETCDASTCWCSSETDLETAFASLDGSAAPPKFNTGCKPAFSPVLTA